MDMAKRLVAVALVAIAVVVGLNLILTPVYHDGGPTYPVWQVINWFMAAAVPVALVVSGLRKRGVASGGTDVVTREYLAATAVFYGSIALVILFYWGWLWTFWPENETGLAAQSHISHFPWVDVLFAWVVGNTGVYLWGGASRQQADRGEHV